MKQLLNRFEDEEFLVSILDKVSEKAIMFLFIFGIPFFFLLIWQFLHLPR
ncbi:hypothetical protein [Sutcliffiella cohnii]|nr:hypothetical protein [Sutcliffiella cohnii]